MRLRSTSFVSLLIMAAASAASGYGPLQLDRGPQNHLLLPARVNGQAASFLLDTGSEISFVQQDRAKAFGVGSSGGEVQNGGRTFRVATIKDLSAGPASFGQVDVALFDPAQFRGPVPGKGGKAADGIIGLDLLRRFGAVINCRTQQLFFRGNGSPPLDLATTTRALGFVQIKLQPTSHGFLSVPCTIGNKAGALYLDTGAFVTVFDRASAHALQLQEAPSKLRARTAGGRVASLQLAKLDHLRIGGIAIEPQRFAVMDLFPDRQPLRAFTGINRIEYYDARAMKARLDIWGLLGSELLYQHSAIIDLESMNLFLK